jgi:hypothetical protein
MRRKKYDNFAALRIAPFSQVPGGKGNLEIISELVNEYTVAFKDRRLHRTGGHVVPIGQRRADRKEHHSDDQQRAYLFTPKFPGTGFEGCKIHWQFDAGARGSVQRLAVT